MRPRNSAGNERIGQKRRTLRTCTQIIIIIIIILEENTIKTASPKNQNDRRFASHRFASHRLNRTKDQTRKIFWRMRFRVRFKDSRIPLFDYYPYYPKNCPPVSPTLFYGVLSRLKNQITHITLKIVPRCPPFPHGGWRKPSFAFFLKSHPTIVSIQVVRKKFCARSNS